jgi:hypothetical protein
VRKDKYDISQEDIEFSILEICTKLDPILMNLNVTSLEDGSILKDFRQDFLFAMVKFGFLSAEAPGRVLGLEQTGEIGTLLEGKDVVEDASDIMDEESAIQRMLERLRELEGNQSVVVSAILEVTVPCFSIPPFQSSPSGICHFSL